MDQLRSRFLRLTHICAEVFYDGGWHFFDVTWGTFYRRPDGKEDDLMSWREIRQAKDARILANTNRSDLWYDKYRREKHCPLLDGPFETKPLVVQVCGRIRVVWVFHENHLREEKQRRTVSNEPDRATVREAAIKRRISKAFIRTLIDDEVLAIQKAIRPCPSRNGNQILRFVDTVSLTELDKCFKRSGKRVVRSRVVKSGDDSHWTTQEASNNTRFSRGQILHWGRNGCPMLRDPKVVAQLKATGVDCGSAPLLESHREIRRRRDGERHFLTVYCSKQLRQLEEFLDSDPDLVPFWHIARYEFTLNQLEIWHKRKCCPYLRPPRPPLQKKKWRQRSDGSIIEARCFSKKELEEAKESKNLNAAPHVPIWYIADKLGQHYTAVWKRISRLGIPTDKQLTVNSRLHPAKLKCVRWEHFENLKNGEPLKFRDEAKPPPPKNKSAARSENPPKSSGWPSEPAPGGFSFGPERGKLTQIRKALDLPYNTARRQQGSWFYIRRLGGQSYEVSFLSESRHKAFLRQFGR